MDTMTTLWFKAHRHNGWHLFTQPRNVSFLLVHGSKILGSYNSKIPGYCHYQSFVYNTLYQFKDVSVPRIVRGGSHTCDMIIAAMPAAAISVIDKGSR